MSIGAHLSLLCAVGHAATFTVNAALVASQWQRREKTFFLHPFINAMHEAGRAPRGVAHQGLALDLGPDYNNFVGFGLGFGLYISSKI